MAQLAIPRGGWENEHLATFLLSRLAFVAAPLTVADDVGSDLFCTLFEARGEKQNEQLFPINSFAIQIKSNRQPINATNKIDYLWTLEVPFFVGVIDRTRLNLSIYSGELLPFLFTRHGRPERLKLHLVDRSSKRYARNRVYMPLVANVSAKDSQASLKAVSSRLRELVSRLQANIARRTSAEYVYETSNGGVALFAGSSSAKTFRRNLVWRIAEAFFNLEWILENAPGDFQMEEFLVYETLVSELTRVGYRPPGVLTAAHARLRRKLQGGRAGRAVTSTSPRPTRTVVSQ